MGEEPKIKGANNSISAFKFGYIDEKIVHLYGIDLEESFCLLAGRQFPNLDFGKIDLLALSLVVVAWSLITRFSENLN